MTLIDCPRSRKGSPHRHRQGSSSQHYCLLIIQVKALSTEKPMGTKEPLPELHWGKMNIQVAWHAIREAVLERDEGVCTMCGSTPSWGDELEVHHIIPRLKGGSHHPLNLITLCKQCHHGRVHGGRGNASKPAPLDALPGTQVSLEDYPASWRAPP